MSVTIFFLSLNYQDPNVWVDVPVLNMSVNDTKAQISHPLYAKFRDADVF